MTNNSQTAFLALASGEVFHGLAMGSIGVCSGELVFNTAMTGYQEVITDPSYCGQIVVFTYPHIGNTGINEEDHQAQHPSLSGIAVLDNCEVPSNHRAKQTLQAYLEKSNLVSISNIDIRAVVTLLREKGAVGAVIVSDGSLSEEEAVARAHSIGDMTGRDLLDQVAAKASTEWHKAGHQLEQRSWISRADSTKKKHCLVIDFGTKNAILDCLVDAGFTVEKSHPDTVSSESLERADAVLLSNGPGDPRESALALKVSKRVIDAKKPILGICYGHQILGLALDCQVIKLPFGHHGINHPVFDHAAKTVQITSQNHGFALDGETIPASIEVTHTSLFDGSVQAIRHKTLPFVSYQGHPEALPGPRESHNIFADFYNLVDRYQ